MVGSWGTCNGCTTLQHDALTIFEKSIIIKDAQARWINAMNKRMKYIYDYIV